MKVYMMFTLCALMIPCLPRRCYCCLDMVLKSFFQMFNPSVEAGPGRLVSRHRYDDGFMPDYPAAVIGHDGEWVKPPDGDDDDGSGGSVPTADYVDDGANGGDGTSSGGGAGGTTSGDNGRHRLGYSIRQQKIDAAAGAATSTGPALRPDDYRPFSDFVVSLLETVQLTSRAMLKRSKGKLDAPSTTKTTKLQSQRHGGILK